ncbi:hypothetical protein NPIL_417671, partial [Nephila pilipes]
MLQFQAFGKGSALHSQSAGPQGTTEDWNPIGSEQI